EQRCHEHRERRPAATNLVEALEDRHRPLPTRLDPEATPHVDEPRVDRPHPDLAGADATERKKHLTEDPIADPERPDQAGDAGDDPSDGEVDESPPLPRVGEARD